MNPQPQFSVVIPVFNEEGSVKRLVTAIAFALKRFAYEIIFVDDGSTDHTRQILKELESPTINFIGFDKNKGQSSALAAGIQRAKTNYIVTMDGDFQNDPSDIPKLLRLLLKEDLDMVIGIRSKRQDSILKTVPSKIANYIIRATTNLQITDSGCALKVMTASTAKSLPLHGELHRFMALNAHIKGAKIKEITVLHHPRTQGISKYGLGRTFKVLKDLSIILFRHKTIKC